jgi:glycosyltransferase involved in cell wall biosynthesis
MIETDNLPFVSIVVVGKNEEKNLNECFQSVFAIDYPSEKLEIIYVDTGSDDRSMDIARRFNVKVVEERSEFPTPGLARNRGIREAKHDIIHFVDGDMTVDAGYLKKAICILGKNNIACVIGRVREQESDRSIIANILNYPWRIREVGFVEAPGAGGTFIRSILQQVGAYNPNILKGQETELGKRIRQKGYRIYMMDSSMGVHDYCFHNLFDFIIHLYVIGKSYGKVLTLPRVESYSDLTARARNLLIQGVVFFVLALILILTANTVVLFGFPILVVIYVLVKYREYYYPRRDWLALSYYLLMHFGKPITFTGMLVFLVKHLMSWRFWQGH